MSSNDPGDGTAWQVGEGVGVQGANSLPVLGVALTLDEFEAVEGLRDFVLEADRDVELRDFIAVAALQKDWREVGRRGRKAFEGHRGRIGIHGPYEGLLVDTPDPEVRAIVQRRLLAALDGLAELADGRAGAHMVLHSPYTTWSWYNRGTEWDDSAGIRERTHATLTPVVSRAEQLGVTLVFENCEDKDPAERVALAASFASPAVAVSLDTGHAHYAHGATGAPMVDAFVRAAGPSLVHVHLQDADGWGDRHWRIGQGTIAWHAVFAALRELPVMPRLILELADVHNAMPSARWLQAAGLAR